MRRSYVILISAISTSIQLAGASPGYGKRQQTPIANCSDPGALFNETCWDALDISDYLGNDTGWVWRYPLCDNSTEAGMSGIGCCLSDEPWSTCYLRFGWGVSGPGCVTINPQECTWPADAKRRLRKTICRLVLFPSDS